MRPPPERRADECAHYSTDIAAAIGALEQFCKTTGRSFQIGNYERPWCAIYLAGIMEHHLTQHYADTLATAICAAILATKGK
jgi:hypothetical protein